MFSTLLVEDDVSYRQSLSDILLLHFPLIGVDEAGDGEEALRKVEYQRPNLIFMDIQLPGENGLQVTREIKRVYDDILIVILTRCGLPESRQQAFRNGADYFLAKGDVYCMEDILFRVDAALAREPATDSGQSGSLSSYGDRYHQDARSPLNCAGLR